MAKLKKKKSAAASEATKEVKDPARSEAMVNYVKDKREAVRAGTFEFKTIGGETIKTADVAKDENDLPIVFDADGNVLYANAPMELFGTTRQGISLRFKYKAKLEENRLPALEAQIAKHQAKADEYLAKSEAVLVEESPEAKKERKKARLLAQLAELDGSAED